MNLETLKIMFHGLKTNFLLSWRYLSLVYSNRPLVLERLRRRRLMTTFTRETICRDTTSWWADLTEISCMAGQLHNTEVTSFVFSQTTLKNLTIHPLYSLNVAGLQRIRWVAKSWRVVWCSDQSGGQNFQSAQGHIVRMLSLLQSPVHKWHAWNGPKRGRRILTRGSFSRRPTACLPINILTTSEHVWTCLGAEVVHKWTNLNGSSVVTWDSPLWTDRMTDRHTWLKTLPPRTALRTIIISRPELKSDMRVLIWSQNLH